MPARLARSGVSVAAPKNAKNKNRKRTLDAYSIAAHSTKERKTVARHRLGEVLDDGPKTKRRRVEDDDDDEQGDSEDEEDEREAKREARRRSAPGDDNGPEEGSDSEGNEWTMGGLAEDDDDSELDSDEAFGESDEEKFEGFTFRGSKGRKSKASKTRVKAKAQQGDNIDLNEDDGGDSDDDSLGDEAVDLATMLDDDGSADEEDAEDDESGSDDDNESSEDSGDSDDQNDNEERIARLRDRIDAMETSTQGKQENPQGEDAAISVDDLLADLDPSAKKQFTSVIKLKKKSAAPQTLTAPLPKRQQDRLDREVAAQKAKEQLDRWRDTVVHNRRAEFLSFPLKDPDQAEPIGKDRFISLTDGREKPQTELEENIRRIMEESGMLTEQGKKPADEENDLLKAEELATKDMPVEEVMRRRAELRRTRELLFREEIKAKRIAKIKSKSYRRVHRKERERMAEKERLAMDPEGHGVPMDDDEKEVADRRRAEARMGTKHRESKWAKSLKASNRTVWDDDAREGALEQARRQEELRKRIAGDAVSDDSADGDFSDDAGSDEDEDAQTLHHLEKLKQSGQGIGQKGVGNMKFMRDAEERQRSRNAEDVERLRRDLAIADGDEPDSDVDQDEGLGRAIFGPRAAQAQGTETAKPKRPELEEGDASGSDGEAGDAGMEDADRPAKQTKSSQDKPAPGRSYSGSGPLAKSSKAQHSKHDDTPEKPSNTTSAWLTDAGAKKSKKDRKQSRETDGVDTIITTITERPAGVENGKTDNKSAKTKSASVEKRNDGQDAGSMNGWTTVPYKNSGEDAADEDAEEIENAMLSAADQKSEYYRRAFAGDDVQLAFDAEKAADAEEEDEKEVSNHLPGWGSWAGDGLSKSIKKANARARHNPLYKTKLPGGVKQEDRRDRKLENVIVSERQDRKGKKYLAPMLPHEFERRDQYERSLRVPVGPEWTTKETFQRSTRPRVVVKQGIVAPMERPLL